MHSPGISTHKRLRFDHLLCVTGLSCCSYKLGIGFDQMPLMTAWLCELAQNDSAEDIESPIIRVFQDMMLHANLLYVQLSCVYRMHKAQPEAEFGPHISFREYSLLDNPRMPASVRSDVLVVGACQVIHVAQSSAQQS